MEENKNNLWVILKGILLAYFVTLLLISIYSALLAYTSLPESTIPICIIVIAIISIMFASSITLKKIKEKGLINGAIIGVSYLLTLYILSSIFAVGFSINTFSIIMLIFCAIAGIIGGVVGVNL